MEKHNHFPKSKLLPDLFSSAYQFIEQQILAGTEWSDLAEVVTFRRNEYFSAESYYPIVFPILIAYALDEQRGESAIPLAASWWMFDLASDLFDDLQDQDGKECPWNEWHPARSMNVGIGLIASAQQALAYLDTTHRKLATILANWARTIIMAARDQSELTHIGNEASYFNHIVTKSGLIFANVSQAAASLVTDDEVILLALHDYGMYLGVLIQLRDDCLDLSPDNLKSDLEQGCYTLPVLYALNQKEHADYQHLKALLTNDSYNKNDLQTICSYIENMEALTYTISVAKAYEAKALNSLELLKMNPYTAHLNSYVQAILPL